MGQAGQEPEASTQKLGLKSSKAPWTVPIFLGGAVLGQNNIGMLPILEAQEPVVL